MTFNPTFNIYSAGRDVMRARNADWHARYTLPVAVALLPAEPGQSRQLFLRLDDRRTRSRGGASTSRYMRLMNDYKNMGGRVTAGSDPGFIYQTWGFSYISELEMLQEAGFSPLEVIQAATINGAREIYEPKGRSRRSGWSAPGMLADLVIVPDNPLAQPQDCSTAPAIKRLEPETEQVERVGGVRWTIKDGIVYDAPACSPTSRRWSRRRRPRRGRRRD